MMLINKPLPLGFTMQRILTSLLICGILGQASIRTVWTLQYQLNRASYVALCVNKNKPALHCDGQCAFMKQIAAREENNSKEPQLPDSFRESKDIQLFFEFQALPMLSMYKVKAAIMLPPYRIFLPDAPVKGIFRPPVA